MDGKRALVVETINKLVSASNAKAKVGAVDVAAVLPTVPAAVCSTAPRFCVHHQAATLCANSMPQVQHIEQLEELLLRNEPALLDIFLSELVPLQVRQHVMTAAKAAASLTAASQFQSPLWLHIDCLPSTLQWLHVCNNIASTLWQQQWAGLCFQSVPRASPVNLWLSLCTSLLCH
jgi:hypothetical protein